MIARSYLYVPANNLEMLSKAPSRGSDALIVDLEDSVIHEEKAQARENLKSWLVNLEVSQQIWVRINAESIDEDLSFIDSKKVFGVVVPKATFSNLTHVANKIGKEIQISALIETADSVLDASRLASISGVSFLQIGFLDLRAELGLSDTDNLDTLRYVLSHLVLASAAAGINQPIAPIFRDFNDLEGLRTSCKELRDNGFFGRSCIHPKQVRVINSEFSTSPEAVTEARAILEALSNSGGVALDSEGRMIDNASARLAQRVIDRGHTS